MGKSDHYNLSTVDLSLKLKIVTLEENIPDEKITELKDYIVTYINSVNSTKFFALSNLITTLETDFPDLIENIEEIKINNGETTNIKLINNNEGFINEFINIGVDNTGQYKIEIEFINR